MVKHKPADQPIPIIILKVILNPALSKTGILCFKRIVYNFFILQYRAALQRSIPVSRVDHPLDAKIPFLPEWVGIYLDFTFFWIRIIGFILNRYGARGERLLGDFIDSMGRLYAFAAEVYAKNLSTTDRPLYFGSLRFILIHAADPHLMCIPSLHVMVMIRSYTGFTAIVRELGDEEALASRLLEARRGALAITEAILYVKQHSVNCIAAAMYAMSCFDLSFPPGEAEGFAGDLFTGPGPIRPVDRAAVRDYILDLYRRFLNEGKNASSWEEPLLRFLRASPKKD
ncbi:MAG: hypothetical protein LBQ14_12445 [Treponema sp.]|jgi:hypothetical protein|nr:hypothetical protein [Treponema sp.]